MITLSGGPHGGEEYDADAAGWQVGDSMALDGGVYRRDGDYAVYTGPATDGTASQ